MATLEIETVMYRIALLFVLVISSQIAKTQVIDGSIYSQSGTFQSFTKYKDDKYLSISSYKTRLSIYMLNSKLEVLNKTSFRLEDFIEGVYVQEGINGEIQVDVNIGKGRSAKYQTVIVDSMLNETFIKSFPERRSFKANAIEYFHDHNVVFNFPLSEEKGISLSKTTVDPSARDNKVLWKVELGKSYSCFKQNMICDKNDNLFLLIRELNHNSTVGNKLMLYKIDGATGNVLFEKVIFLKEKNIFFGRIKMVEDQVLVEGNFGQGRTASTLNPKPEGFFMRLYDATTGELQLKSYYPIDAVFSENPALDKAENTSKEVKMVDLNRTNSGYVGFLYCSGKEYLKLDAKVSVDPLTGLKTESFGVELKRVQMNFKGQASLVEKQVIHRRSFQGKFSLDNDYVYFGDESYKEGYLWLKSDLRIATKKKFFKIIKDGWLSGRIRYYRDPQYKSVWHLPKNKTTLYEIKIKDTDFRVFENSAYNSY